VEMGRVRPNCGRAGGESMGCGTEIACIFQWELPKTSGGE
jgi:hypothetical protein